MLKVDEVSIGVDLSLFSRWLTSQQVHHRISEENGAQVLWLEDERAKDSVGAALSRYLNDGEFKEQLDKYSAQITFSYKANQSGLPRPTVAEAPVTMLLIFLSAALALITNFGDGGPVLRALLIVNPLGEDFPTIAAKIDVLMGTLESFQFWRLFSPDFIHYDVTHLVFNMLMLWFLGGQVERSHGWKRLMVIFVACSVVPNVAQYIEAGPLFGGMSGVVYGLVGYCWVWSRTRPGELVFPPALMGVSVAWMIIGYTPLMETLLGVKMANSAHSFGLLMGVVVAFTLSNISAVTKKSS